MVEPYAINEQLARRLVDSQFPQLSSLSLKPVARQGVDNRTFRLGDDLSVRLPAGDWYALQVAKEQHWLPRLAPLLPLPIPQPLAQGAPAIGYPYTWSIYRWLDGTTAAEAITDWTAVASLLGTFLSSLHRIDASGGPEPGPHNFFRGGPVTVYADETAAATTALGTEVDRAAIELVWQAATATQWTAEPRWFHGDVAPDNLLTHGGQLTAVIDFGTSGIGDPACDTVIAWTHLDSISRTRFRRAIDVDIHTWERGRGWALWKALITLVKQLEQDDDHRAAMSRATINRTIEDNNAGR